MWFRQSGNCLTTILDFPSHRFFLALVQVIYPSKTLHPARGSSVKLSCEVNYDFKECDLLYAGWGLGTAKLTNPSKYFTTVNETDSGGNMRRRQVVTEILDLTPNDNGRYQCVAVCNSLDDARGHYIWITVKGIVFNKKMILTHYIHTLMHDILYSHSWSWILLNFLNVPSHFLLSMVCQLNAKWPLTVDAHLFCSVMFSCRLMIWLSWLCSQKIQMFQQVQCNKLYFPKAFWDNLCSVWVLFLILCFITYCNCFSGVCSAD